MKKFIITFFSIVFLLPAFAYAGSYCVEAFARASNHYYQTIDG